MGQPAGTVVGSLTLFRADGLGGGEWWQVSRHALGNRVCFWERVFRGRPDMMVQVADRQTDEMWGNDSADEWVSVQVRTRYSSGFKLSQLDGMPGPTQLVELFNTNQTTPGQDKP